MQVEPVSCSTVVRDRDFAMFAVRHHDDGRRGYVLDVTSIRWIDDDRITAEGGYYQGGRCAGHYRLELVRQAGGWTVESAVPLWFS